MTRKILISNQHPEIQFSEEAIKMLFHRLDAFDEFHIPTGELSIVLMNDPALAKLHYQFLDDPSTTDVMTFPGNVDHEFAGEICVSVDYALRLSKELQIPFLQELTLYLVHGWLHLAGLDDRKAHERSFMRKAEKITLTYLEAQKVIPSFSLC